MTKKDDLWMLCVHVTRGEAEEVWLRPDQIAVCPLCAISDPFSIPDEDLVVLCSHHARKAIEKIAVIEMMTH